MTRANQGLPYYTIIYPELSEGKQKLPESSIKILFLERSPERSREVLPLAYSKFTTKL